MAVLKSVTRRGVAKLRSVADKTALISNILVSQPQGILWENTKARDGVVFGFFGELGYGLTSFWPYLAWLSYEQKVPVRTAGLPGTTAFVPFSIEHHEVDVPRADSRGGRSWPARG